MILCFAGGWFGYSYINQVSGQSNWGFLWVLGVIFVTITSAIIGLYLNIVLHEAGHLLGGLFTGSRFAAFSVFNILIVKKNGKLTVKKCGVPGASGICVLSPPNMRNGTYPFKLSASSGFLVNFLLSFICLILFYCFAGIAAFWAKAFLVSGIVGAFLGIINFIPINTGVALSDGYVVFNLGKEKNKTTRLACWSIFRINALDAEGVRPRDIPAELFNSIDVGNINDIFVLLSALYQYKYLVTSKK